MKRTYTEIAILDQGTSRSQSQQISCSKSRANTILIKISCLPEQHKDAGYTNPHVLSHMNSTRMLATTRLLSHMARQPALVEPRVYVELEALVPKATARVYMEAPGAKTEAPKQPKKQDETEAPPG